MTKVNFRTATGTAKYPWLTRPDTQFDAEGVYSTFLLLDEKDAAPLIDLMNETAVAEFGAKAKFKLPVSRDEETGKVQIKVKSKYQPKIYDSKGQIIPPSHLPPIFGGSELRIRGTMNAYAVSGTKGVALQLGKVQIVNLSQGSGGDDSGFDEIEGSFVLASDAPQTAKAVIAGEDDFDF